MKQKKWIIVASLVVAVIVLLVIFVQQNVPCSRNCSCEELSKNFDKLYPVDAQGCDIWAAAGANPIWVGGTLIEINSRRPAGDPRFDGNNALYSLKFRGLKKEGRIHIVTARDQLPYVVNKFYKFDLGRECMLIYSMVSSGAFFDPDLNALELLACK